MLQHTRSCAGWRSWTCSNSAPGLKHARQAVFVFARCIPHRRRFPLCCRGTLACLHLSRADAARSDLTNTSLKFWQEHVGRPRYKH